MPGEFDMNQMQEEAIRRAREMQSRARIPPRQNRRPEHRNEPAAAPAEPPRQEEREPREKPVLPVSNGENAQPGEAEASQAGLLETLFQDKERTIILALLILLSGEESNHELMFALMFLLM